MDTDGNFTELLVDGQTLYVPSSIQWQSFWAEPVFQGVQIPVPSLLASKVAANQRHPEILSALGFAYGRVIFYELLYSQDEYFRVFVEAVICDNCGYRAVKSATPGVSDIYLGSTDTVAAKGRSFSLPRQCCFGCGQLLERRRTVWQSNQP